MFLITPGRKPRKICIECRSLHGAKDCPKRGKKVRSHTEFMEMVKLAKQINEERYAAMGVR